MGEETNWERSRGDIKDPSYLKARKLWSDFVQGKITSKELKDFAFGNDEEVEKIKDFFEADILEGEK